MRKLGLLAVAVVVLLAAFTVPVLAQDTGHVRVAHFSPGTPAVDVYVNGELTDIVDFAFGSVTDWMELPAGSYDLAIAPTGTSIDDAVITVSGWTLDSGAWVTLAAIGEIARDTLAVQPIVEDFSDLGLGVTRITLFHAIPDGPAVDVYLGDRLLVRGFTYPGKAAELGISDEPAANDGTFITNFDEGTYDVKVTAIDDADTVILDLPATELKAGNNYLIAAVGIAADPTVVVATTNVEEATSGMTAPVDVLDFGSRVCEGSGDATVRVAHFASLARPDENNAVDVYLNGELALENLGQGSVTDFIALAGGNYDVDVVPTGAAIDEAVIKATGVALCPDDFVTVAAIGFAERDSLEILPIYEDYSELGLNVGRFTIVHAIPDLGPINVFVNDQLVVGTLGYPRSLADLQISDDPAANDGVSITDYDAGTYTIKVTPFDDANTVLATFDAFELANGRNVLIAAIGSAAAPAFVVVPTEVSAVAGG